LFAGIFDTFSLMDFWYNHRKTVHGDEPLDNSKLKKAFEKLRLYNTEFYYRKALDEIKVANFLFLIIDAGNWLPDSPVNPVVLTNAKGEVFLPLFSDDDEAQSHRPPDIDVAAIVVDVLSVCNMVVKDDAFNGVVINPGSDDWLMNREFIGYLLGARKY
jgi:hypothetical protein